MDNTLNKLTVELGKVFSNVGQAFRSPEDIKKLINLLGWEVPPSFNDLAFVGADVKEVLEKLNDVLNSTIAEREDEMLMLTRITKLTAAIIRFVDQIVQVSNNLNTSLAGLGDYVIKTEIDKDFFKRFFDFLIISYISANTHTAFAIVQFLSIFEQKSFTADPDIYQCAHVRNIIHYDRISTLFTNPGNLMQEGYGWGTGIFSTEDFLRNFALLVSTLGGDMNFQFMSRKVEEALLKKSTPEADTDPSAKAIFTILRDAGADTRTEIKLIAYGVRPSVVGGTDGGIGFFPLIRGTTSIEFPLNDNLKLGLEGNIDFNGGLNIIIRPNQLPLLETGMFNGPANIPIAAKIMARLLYEKSTNSPITLLSFSGGSKLEFQKASLKLGAEKQMTDSFEPLMELEIKNLRLVITLSSADSFIKSGIKQNELATTFDITIGWSKNGIYFKGSAALELLIPTNIQFGPIQISSVLAAIKANNNVVTLALGATFKISLGPLIALVENIGANGDFSFNKPNNNLGVVDFNLGFKPPTGIGISLDTEVLKADGFLRINEEKGEYIGAVVIFIKSIELRVAAVGIINTKLPGGQEGFSFLIIITAEFPPIPLAFGFTLNGLGGLLGVRRTMLTDQLRAGIKSNTLEGILFPKIDVKNVGTIVSNLQQVFPISTDERFLIGPMIKIGWGTPSIITAEIGIIIELPNPVQIAIIGIVRLSLPTPAKEIIHLQINFLGVIDFEKKLLSLDAALEDSRILTMTLTGQFALRVGWGSTPLFIFSAGGFHPGFKEAPAELQGMERLGIKVFDETNFKLSIDSYFALTTNTVQFGAHAHAIAILGPFTAVADASFDALIIFNPFAFNVQLQVSGRVTGPLVDAVVEVQASLTGPNRWHVWGHAYAKLVVPIMIPFDTTFGDPIEELASETIDVLKLLREEVEKVTNWKADTPAYNTSGITLRNLSAVEIGDDIIIHPNTTLSFRQQLVPLGVTIDKFGNKIPVDSAGGSGSEKFWISCADPEKLKVGEALNDLFVPGNFFNLPKDQKLSRPSFEPMQSGNEFTIKTSENINAATNDKSLDFEIIYIYNDDVQKQPAGTPLPLTDIAMQRLAGGSAASKSKLSVEKNRPSHQATSKITQYKATYLVARKSDLKVVSEVEYTSQAEAYIRLKDFAEEDHIVISNFEL